METREPLKENSAENVGVSDSLSESQQVRVEKTPKK
jgi:hypothetical protein